VKHRPLLLLLRLNAAPSAVPPPLPPGRRSALLPSSHPTMAL
jgi:hypothetical protein